MKDEALKLALEALENSIVSPAMLATWGKYQEAREHKEKTITAIKQALAAPVQEPVAWPCLIAEADFEQNTITLEMQCSDYKVGAGQHWLHTTPPAQPAVPLKGKQIEAMMDKRKDVGVNYWQGVRDAEAAHGITKGQ